MGRRSAGETLARILVAFLRSRTWSQADLARHCGVAPKAVRARLLELNAAGVPLESEADKPHVYWSVPKTWFPQATPLDPAQVALIARLLSRLPASKQRSQALQALLGVDDAQALVSTEDAALTAVLTTLEDGMRDRRVVQIDYYTVSRGDRGKRDVSVHRILYGDRMRFLATCHRAGTLKYFRVDETRHASLGRAEAFRDASADEIKAFLATSMDGYRVPGPPVRHTFVVRFPEARWAKRNHPPCEMQTEPTEDGLRFTAHIAGVDPLARFVVGLGAAARAESRELAQRVKQLAVGALDGMKPVRKVNMRSVRPIRAAD